jgi:hypothetical protein
MVEAIGLISALRGKSYVALLREGILQKEALSWSFDRPWPPDERAAASGWPHGRNERANWRLRRLGRGWDIGIALWTIARSDELVALVKRCVADPDARASLGNGAV